MTTYTGTGIGLDEGNTGAQNLTAYNAWLGTAGAPHILEVDGMFPINVANNNPVAPNGTTIRAETPGATQGFDVVGTTSASSDWRAMVFNEALLQGLTFTASDAPDVDPDFDLNNPTPGVHFHEATMIAVGSDTVVEFCKFSGCLRKLIYVLWGTDGLIIRDCEIAGGYYSLEFWDAANCTVLRNYFHDALVDNIKINKNSAASVDELLIDTCYFLRGRDGLDGAGTWTNIDMVDTIFVGQRVCGIDTKTSYADSFAQNQYLTTTDCRFVNCQRAVATAALDAGPSANIAIFEARMPQDFTFIRPSFEKNDEASWVSCDWLLKGGGGFTYQDPKYYGTINQGFQPSNSFNEWPTSWTPTDYDDDDANKQTFAARSTPTMPLAVGPENWNPTGLPSATVAVSPTSGSEASTTSLTITVTASAAVSGDQTVDLGLTGASDADFDETVPASVTILDGQTTGVVNLTVTDDETVEGAEIATFTISNPSAGLQIGTPLSATFQIADNDSTPSAAEGGAARVGGRALRIGGRRLLLA